MARFVVYGFGSVGLGLGRAGPYLGGVLITAGFGFTQPSYIVICSWRVAASEQVRKTPRSWANFGLLY
jgi:hypothetical protein